METNNNSAMKKLSVDETYVQRKNRNGDNYISLIEEIKPIYGILLQFTGSLFTTLGIRLITVGEGLENF